MTSNIQVGGVYASANGRAHTGITVRVLKVGPTSVEVTAVAGHYRKRERERRWRFKIGAFQHDFTRVK